MSDAYYGSIEVAAGVMIGARMNNSHLRRVRKGKRKNKGRGVSLDSSLLMGDTFTARRERRTSGP